MEDGRWKMEDGRWKMEDGRWKIMKNEKLKAEGPEERSFFRVVK